MKYVFFYYTSQKSRSTYIPASLALIKSAAHFFTVHVSGDWISLLSACVRFSGQCCVLERRRSVEEMQQCNSGFIPHSFALLMESFSELSLHVLALLHQAGSHAKDTHACIRTLGLCDCEIMILVSLSVALCKSSI